MRIRLLFIISAIGLLIGLVSAYFSAQQAPAQPPLFSPAPNPYGNGIFANGIIESRQTQGANISISPEVSGPVTHVLVHEGEAVRAGEPLLSIDDSVQRQTT